MASVATRISALAPSLPAAWRERPGRPRRLPADGPSPLSPDAAPVRGEGLPRSLSPDPALVGGEGRREGRQQDRSPALMAGADAVWASEAPDQKPADAVWASEAPDQKSSAAGPLIAIQSLRQPVWAPRDMAAFAREGYAQNPIVYRCVRMIAEAAAAIPFLLYAGDHEIETHPLLDLVRRPNAVETGTDLTTSLLCHLLVSGNGYLEAVAIGDEIRELHVLRPDRIRVVPGADGWPEAWDYTVAGRTVRIQGEPVPGIRPVLHLKLFHPADDHYGMSPLEPAAAAIDLHNVAARWNKALLDNSARPSGALVYTARDGNLTSEQYERLKSELEQGFQGSANAGRPLLLEGGLDWKSMSLTPKDMDFNEARHTAAREIALALGVPPMLLGIPGDNTYSNLAEATRSFWRATVLPLAERLAATLSVWPAPAFGDALTFRPDFDRLPALASEREALWASLEKTTFLSTNEKRALAGFTPVDGGDEVKFNPSQPRIPAGNGRDSGRWTFGRAEDAELLSVAKRPKPGDKKPKQDDRADHGATPGGKRYTKHGKEQATDREFTDKHIDDIVANNRRESNGVDLDGRKTWRHTDNRGNTVISNESGGIVSVFSKQPGGKYVPKP